MEYAVSIGADPATWTRSQFVRMPDGTRENGKRQLIHHFDPQPLESQHLSNQNWLEMKFDREFAAILGDKVFDNVPFRLWPLFKRRLVEQLGLHGSLIIRVAPQDPVLMGCSFSELLEYWTTRYEQGGVSCADAASGLWEQALGASAKSVPGKQTIGAFRHELRNYARNLKSRSTKDAQLFRSFNRLFHRSGSHEWTSYTLGNVIDALAEELVLTGISRSSDYVVGLRQPVLEFRFSSALCELKRQLV